MDKLIIGYFLEDGVHESFIRSIVIRIMDEIGLPGGLFEHKILCASGGSMSETELLSFLNDIKNEAEVPVPLLVIAKDANCRGFITTRNFLQRKVDSKEYSGPVVFAIPNPHIERWYLLDFNALSIALGASLSFDLPRHKCARSYYKKILAAIFKEAGLRLLLGGAEIAEEYTANLDLYAAGQRESNFDHFVSDVRSKLRCIKISLGI